MRKIFLFLLFIAGGLLPTAGLAATVGFVPNTGLWFSKNEFTPGEVIQVYTVVVNNEYYAMEGTVGFYDNDKLINKVEVKNLLKGKAEQLAVNWKPIEGAHSLNARFIRAAALDAHGKKLILSLESINSMVGVSLRLGGSESEAALASAVQPGWSPGAQVVVNPTSGAAADTVNTGIMTTKEATAPTAGAEASPTPAPVEVVVKKQGGKLVLATSASSVTGAANSTVSSSAAPADLGGKVDEIFAKNRAAIAKAQELVGTITSTAGTISNFYAKTKAATAKGQEYYEAGERQWNRLQPYWAKVTTTFQKLEPAWQKISGGNNPKRIAAVGGIGVLVWILWRLARSRSREFYD